MAGKKKKKAKKKAKKKGKKAAKKARKLAKKRAKLAKKRAKKAAGKARKSAPKAAKKSKPFRPAAALVPKLAPKPLPRTQSSPAMPRPSFTPALKPASAARPTLAAPPGMVVKGAIGPRYKEILTPVALGFIADLHRKFDAARRKLLARRGDIQRRFDAGALPDFLPETQAVRDGAWKIAALPRDLLDRRVEITGPVDRKMVINALNSDAQVYMADFEDACSPSWANIIEGQINLKDRWAGRLEHVDLETGKSYALDHKLAVLMVRPRGWHLTEEHVSVDGAPVSGALFDFGLYLFHNAARIRAAGTGPYFYLAKIENHLEARLWNDVFVHAQEKLGLAQGSIKATVLIETLPAAFEMDEILYEMRDHIAGLNCGRWDYIFSFIKRLGKNKRFLTPDRAVMGMDRAFLRAYSLLLIKTCHRRGAFAMGGMAAQIPVKGDEQANKAAFAKVRVDKEREAGNGHDGTWVAHPGLVPVAEEAFARFAPNQLGKLRQDVAVTRDQLLEVHPGARTEDGLRLNIRVGIRYLEAWLQGRGAVPLYNLMEDAATAEISRAQVWQWLYHRARLADGREVTPDLFRAILADEMAKVRQAVGPTTYDAGRFEDAIELFTEMSLALDIEEFLTVPAYRLIV
jgi:malate synthase